MVCSPAGLRAGSARPCAGNTPCQAGCRVPGRRESGEGRAAPLQRFNPRAAARTRPAMENHHPRPRSRFSLQTVTLKAKHLYFYCWLRGAAPSHAEGRCVTGAVVTGSNYKNIALKESEGAWECVFKKGFYTDIKPEPLKSFSTSPCAPAEHWISLQPVPLTPTDPPIHFRKRSHGSPHRDTGVSPKPPAEGARRSPAPLRPPPAGQGPQNHPSRAGAKPSSPRPPSPPKLLREAGGLSLAGLRAFAQRCYKTPIVVQPALGPAPRASRSIPPTLFAQGGYKIHGRAPMFARGRAIAPWRAERPVPPAGRGTSPGTALGVPSPAPVNATLRRVGSYFPPTFCLVILQRPQ